MNFKIKNAIPLWIVMMWLSIGLLMFIASISWELMELIDEKLCFSSLHCMVFDFMMFLTHYLGIFLLVMGFLVLLGNEKDQTK